MSANRQRWKEKTQEAIQKQPERKDGFRTDSELAVDRLYIQEEQSDSEFLEKIGFPGEFPFTRGVYPSMYRGRLWTMRQYAGFGSAEETNERYKYLVEAGQTGLSVAFDLPTQMGYDSDHAMALGEVGKAGVAISSLKDMEILFAGIPLGKVSTSMTINAPASILLAMYVAVAEQQGVSYDQIAGTTQNDILKEYIARKTYIFPPEFSMRLATDVIIYCAERLPKWNPISISGYHMREAGATASQEIAFTLANGLEYINAVLARGMDIDRFASQLSFFFSCDNNFLEEIAKFRAARRLWARLVKECFGAKKKESMMLRFHTQTGGSTLTAQQPWNNVIRTTLQALAAVLGGTQSLHTNSYDEALALPTAEAVRIALRTQQIIAEESGAADTIDPLGGSYYLEDLTDRLEAEARRYIAKVDDLGGMRKAIEMGYIQREIEQTAYRKQREIEGERRVVVGVNAFIGENSHAPKVMKVVPEVVEKQVRRLQDARRSRDTKAVQQSLEKLKTITRTSENLMPAIMDAVKTYATVGEICDIFRAEFGQYHEPVTV
jgi:methylmalonyl-CoA mutase N-terminal domain/subunit